MLPPDIEDSGNNMIYKFFSLVENKVLSLNKKNRGGEEKLLPDDDAKLVGSSYGWLALLNKRNSDMFLSNPLSGRNIKLPPLETLPIPEINLTDAVGVEKLITSCSPADEEDCRAMINYAPSNELAFCCPGRSTEWIPIGTESSFRDFVYFSRQKLFICITGIGHFESWDLQDPLSPKLIPMDISMDEEYHPWFAQTEEEFKLKVDSFSQDFLVVAEKSNELYFVRRFILERIGPDGAYVEHIYYGPDRGYDLTVPYKTIDFTVHKYDPEERSLKYMNSGSLDGMALFIGSNHGFALCASEFPELKPNCIYFTDAYEVYLPLHDNDYGGHDLGIFNYENKTISPCYYPCDVQSIKRIEPAPRWFTPSQHYETSV